MTYYGNMFSGTAMLDAKPIDGSDKIVASFSPGHGRYEHMGHVTILDSAPDPDDPDTWGRIRITPTEPVTVVGWAMITSADRET